MVGWLVFGAFGWWSVGQWLVGRLVSGRWYVVGWMMVLRKPLVFCPEYIVFLEMNILKTFSTVKSGS